MNARTKCFLSLLLTLALLMGIPGALAEGSLTFPSDLEVIGESAFENIGAKDIAIPAGISVQRDSFKGAKLIRLGATPPDIEHGAFDDDVTISAPRGSHSYGWAEEQGFNTVYRGYEYEAPNVFYATCSDGSVEEDAEEIEFVAETGLSATRLEMYAQDANPDEEEPLQTWELETSQVEDQKYARVWTVPITVPLEGTDFDICAVNACGSYGAEVRGEPCLLFIAFNSSGDTEDELIYNYLINSEELFGDYDEETITVPVGTTFDLDFSVGNNGVYVQVVVDGTPVGTPTYYESENYGATIPYTFDQVGEFNVRLRASTSQDMTDAMVTPRVVKFVVVDEPAVVRAYAMSAPCKGIETPFRVEHTSDAEYIALFDESGEQLAIESAGTSSDEDYYYDDSDGDEYYGGDDGDDGEQPDLIVTTDLSCVFDTAGEHTITAKASVDGETWSDASCTFTIDVSAMAFVMEITNLTGKSMSCPEAIKGKSHPIGFATSANARYAALYENGKQLFKWTANSSNTDIKSSSLLWTVNYTFPTEGMHQYTIKASADGTTYGEGCDFGMTVVTKPSIYSVDSDYYLVDEDPETYSASVEVNASYAVNRIRLSDANGKKIKELEPDEPDAWGLQKSATFDLDPGLTGWHLFQVQLSLDNGKSWSAAETVSARFVCSDDSKSIYEENIEGTNVTFELQMDGLDSELSDIQGIRMLNAKSGALLREWLPADMSIRREEEDEGSDYFYVYYDFTCDFGSAGRRFLQFQHTFDGVNWIEDNLLDLIIPDRNANELTRFECADQLEAIEGDLKLTTIQVYYTDAEADSEFNHAAFTPIENPGKFYAATGSSDVEHGRLWIYQLKGVDTGYTIYGLKPGMTRAQVRAAALSYGLRTWNTRMDSIPADMDFMVYSPPYQMDYCVWVNYENGKAVRITACESAGD